MAIFVAPNLFLNCVTTSMLLLLVYRDDCVKCNHIVMCH